ncbi:MAG: hypothetical protein SF051_03455, partial [Elusimicrobiota bacterium]|nr:hypothetical protein [Elusimicrobiota bacterium]
GRVETRDGAATLEGAPTGRLMPDAPGGPVVLVSRLFMALPEASRDHALAETIAHELLGHLLYMRGAQRDGLSAFPYHRDDEVRARLIGALVVLESGGTPRHAPDPSDVPATYRALARRNPHYALGLSTAEMADPAGAYAARRDELRAETRDAATRLTADEAQRLSACLEALEDAAGPGGAALRETIRREAGEPFYRALEDETRALTARLAGSAAASDE